MEKETRYCNDCEEELNAENTGSYGGFDSTNHYYSTIYGGDGSTAPFTKCDGCFDADIDRYLETAFE
jgi:hypothetical protein